MNIYDKYLPREYSGPTQPLARVFLLRLGYYY